MSVWEITNKWMNDVAMLTHPDDIEFDPEQSVSFWKQFDGNGGLLEWRERPRLVVMIEEGRKKRPPRADISSFTAPGLVLNEKARSALASFLLKFGQLLEIEVEGDVEYYYNVTNVVPSLDRDRSEIWPTGYVERPVFSSSAVPKDPAVFREPSISSRLFVNDEAKEVLDRIIAEHKLIGMSFKKWGYE
jgi:hypothetical protein